jgi:hypothetical protein
VREPLFSGRQLCTVAHGRQMLFKNAARLFRGVCGFGRRSVRDE